MSQSPVDSILGDTAAVRPQAPEGGRTGRIKPHPALVLTVLATSMFLSALDSFVVNVALAPIGRGLGAMPLPLLWA